MDKKLINYLDGQKVKYKLIEHKTVYTATDKAATLHIDPKGVLKTIVVKLDAKNFLLAVIPSHRNLDKKSLLKAANLKRKKEGLKAIKGLSFAAEAWMKNNIKGCKIGSTHPLGHLWNLPTAIDNQLWRQKELIASAGDYEHSVIFSKSAFEKALGDNIIKGNFSQKK